MSLARGATITGTDATGPFSSRASDAFVATAGRLLVVMVSWEDGETLSSVADTAGGTWVLGTHVQSPDTQSRCRLAYCLSTPGHATNVVTATFSGGTAAWPMVCGQEYYDTGGGTWTLDDEQTFANDAATSFTSPSVTAEWTNQPVFIGVTTGDAQTFTPTGYTLVHQDASTPSDAAFDNISGAAGARAPNIAWTNGSATAAFIATFTNSLWIEIVRASGQTPTFAETASSGTTLDVTLPQNVVVGNSVIVVARNENSVGGTPPSITVTDQTLGHTPILAAEYALTDEFRISIWIVNITTAGSLTLRMTSGSTHAKAFIGAMEYETPNSRGLAFDKSASATGASTAPNSGNTATTSHAVELLIGAICDTFNGHPFTAGTDWTETLDTNGSGGPSTYMEERVVSSTGTYAATATATNSVTWGALIATFFEIIPAPKPPNLKARRPAMFSPGVAR